MGILKRNIMRMKTTSCYFFSLLAVCLFLLSGCAEEEPSGQRETRTLKSLHATMAEAVKTKAYLTQGNNVVWEEEDVIGVFSDQTKEPIPFFCTNVTNDGGDFEAFDEIAGNTFYAIYPFTELSIAGNQAICYLSDWQAYRKGSFDSYSCPMIAVSTDNQFHFRQTCGLIRVKLKGAMQVTRLELVANDGTYLSGTGTIDFNEDTPTFRIAQSSQRYEDVVIYTDSPLQLSATEETSFYFVLPPLTLEEGFTLRIFDEQNNCIEKRTDKPVRIDRAGITTFATIDTDNELAKLEQEAESNREALIALYHATGGSNWTNHANWNTDAPLSEWYGVYTDDYGRVVSLDLRENNLTGSLPEEIGMLTTIHNLYLTFNKLNGSIPPEIGNLTNLDFLDLFGNELSGTFPAGLARLKNLRYLNLQGNNFSGTLPSELTATDWWQKWGWDFLEDEYKFDFNSFNLYLPDITYPDHNGNELNTHEYLDANRCILFHGWTTDYFSEYVYNYVTEAYEQYKDDFGFLGYCTADEGNREEMLACMEQYGMEWPVMPDVESRLQETWKGCVSGNFIYFFDRKGKLVYSSRTNFYLEDLKSLLQKLSDEGYFTDGLEPGSPVIPPGEDF